MSRYAVILLFISFFILFGCTSKRQPSKPKATTRIEWQDGKEYNFGTVRVKDTMRYDFVFRNIGKIPFAIDSIKTSCGCITAKYIKRGVLPGKTDTLHIAYDGNGFYPGPFIKACTVYSNADSVYTLYIRGYYIEEE